VNGGWKKMNGKGEDGGKRGKEEEKRGKEKGKNKNKIEKWGKKGKKEKNRKGQFRNFTTLIQQVTPFCQTFSKMASASLKKSLHQRR
jgi:hypothetical protein